MILSVSRRTDIPAFYADWFLQRLREGYVLVRNPMNPHKVSRVALSPQVVDCIVFWSKNPAPLLQKLEQLQGYDYYFQYTLNAYGAPVEPHLPPLEERLRTFGALAERIGRERVIWRYDPILFTQRYTPQWHLEKFAQLAARLQKSTEKCVFSLVDIYAGKNGGNLARLGAYTLPPPQLEAFVQALAEIAAQNGLRLATCAENLSAEKYGILPNSCIDKALIERLTGAKLRVGLDGQRPYCQCVKCDDIGSYDTCPHGCLYCYANFRPEVVQRRAGQYDPLSPLLCDRLDAAVDSVVERPVRSLKLPPADDGGVEQLTLF